MVNSIGSALAHHYCLYIVWLNTRCEGMGREREREPRSELPSKLIDMMTTSVFAVLSFLARNRTFLLYQALDCLICLGKKQAKTGRWTMRGVKMENLNFLMRDEFNGSLLSDLFLSEISTFVILRSLSTVQGCTGTEKKLHMHYVFPPSLSRPASPYYYCCSCSFATSCSKFLTFLQA